MPITLVTPSQSWMKSPVISELVDELVASNLCKGGVLVILEKFTEYSLCILSRNVLAYNVGSHVGFHLVS